MELRFAINFVAVAWEQIRNCHFVQDFEARVAKEREEMEYRDHLKEQEWLIEMRKLDETRKRQEDEDELKLRLLQKRILMSESDKEVTIQNLLESQELQLKEMNDECEKKVCFSSLSRIFPPFGEP